jgi:hypothetical protein
MDARTQRTLLQLLGLFLAAGAGDAIVQFANGPTYDWRHLLGALVAAVVMGGREYLANTGDFAPPTVAAVNRTLQTVLRNPLVSVPPPKTTIEPWPTVVADDPRVESP